MNLYNLSAAEQTEVDELVAYLGADEANFIIHAVVKKAHEDRLRRIYLSAVARGSDE